MPILFHPCTEDDLDQLRSISCQTFSETFADSNNPSQLQAHLDTAYAPDKLRQELTNPASQFYFLYDGEVLAGYLKLNEASAQSELHDPSSLEIERIYLCQAFQGHGLGRYLMEQAIAIAISRQKSYLWLGVWEHNTKALAFYQRFGFYRIGSHSFFVGQDEQTDFLLRKDIAADTSNA